MRSLFSARVFALQVGFGVLIIGLNAPHTPAASLIAWIVFYIVFSLLLNVVLTKAFVRKNGRHA